MFCTRLSTKLINYYSKTLLIRHFCSFPLFHTRERSFVNFTNIIYYILLYLNAKILLWYYAFSLLYLKMYYLLNIYLYKHFFINNTNMLFLLLVKYSLFNHLWSHICVELATSNCISIKNILYSKCKEVDL